jgi:Transposase DDE domain group 1
VATAITAAQKSWISARKTASTSSSAWQQCRAVEITADDIRTRRALTQASVPRGYAETKYQAKSWAQARRVCARIEATTLGLDIRFVATNLATGSAEHIYDILYCARGRADAQDPARLRPNQVPFAARQSDAADPAHCCLLAYADSAGRDPQAHVLATAEFTTIRLRLLKLGAGGIETALRIHLAFAAACPHAALFRQLATTIVPAAS